MAEDPTVSPSDTRLTADLSEEERRRLEIHRHCVKGDEVLWVEPGGNVRREPIENVYYLQTDRGVFRVSRITHRVVEV